MGLYGFAPKVWVIFPKYGFGLLSAVQGLSAYVTDTPSKQPNIVMILVDDLGWGDLACYGNPEALTPRLDTLAKEGQKFTNFRANCSVCSPTRVALTTGMVPDRAGVPGVIRTHADNSWGYFSPNVDTLPQLLKTAGYRNRSRHFKNADFLPIQNSQIAHLCSKFLKFRKQIGSLQSLGKQNVWFLENP